MDIEALNLLIWELVFLVAELALYMFFKGADLIKKKMKED